MRRIVNTTFISLDGVMEHMEHWHFDYIDDEFIRIVTEQTLAGDALLMGRRTYEVYASSWPDRDGEVADHLNRIQKYVASTTMDRADWENTTVIRDDLVGAVRELKQEAGRDILMHGFGPVARTLLQGGLLDEVQLWVHPVLAGVGGTGEMLFTEGQHAVLELLDAKRLGSGIVILSYRPRTSG